MTELSYPMAEEFHAIGLRPMEFRPAVIRRAMNRSAAPLATAHLHQPDDTVERKLALIATTGYRLLDPRRREDSIHRMMLGRIHPQLADEAVRIAQSRGNQLTEIESAEGDESSHFIRGGLLKTRGHAGPHRHRNSPHNGFVNDATNLWNDSLRSNDLLIERPMKRLFRTTRRWASQRYIAIASVSGLVLMMIGTWRVSRDGDVITVAEVSPERDPSGLSAKPPIDEITVEAAPLPASLGSSKSVEVETIVTGQLASKPVVTASFINAIIAAEADEESDVETPVVAPNITAITTTEEAKIEQVPQEASASKHPVPLAADLALQQDAWKLSLSTLPESDWQAKLVQSVKFADDAETGSNDQWVGLRGAALFAIFGGKFAEADRAMIRMIDDFQTDLATLSKDIATQCIATPLGTTESFHVEDWLEGWFGRSLLAGEFDDASFFALHFDQLAKSLSDRPLNERSKELAGSLDTAQRLAETAERVELMGDDAASASERLAAGRYWGLIRQQWMKALPHFAAGSDARLASLADSESLLGGLPEPRELIELAEGYLSLARKSRGWQQTSYILHANEILHRDASQAANVQTLELARIRRQLHTDHESVLALADLLVVAKPVMSEPLKSVSPTLATNSEMGMLGRIRVGAEDVGVLLRYEPGVKLTTRTLEQIANKLDSALQGASIDLVGTISVDHPTAITIEAPGPGTDGKPSVSLDDHPLEKSASGTRSETSAVYRTDLPPGQWTIRWTVSSVNSSGSTLRIMDALSGMPIRVDAPQRTIKDHPGTLPTRLRVSVMNGQ